MRLRPLGKRVLVRPDRADEVTASGIILPPVAREQPHQGTVLAVGPELHGVEVGDTVVYSKYGASELQIGPEDYVIVEDVEVLAVVEGRS